MKKSVPLALALLASLSLPALADGDVEKGKAVFNKCKACHENEKGVNKVGPTLKGVIGRATASVPDYKYSEAMLEYAKANPVWDDAHFLTYIENPKAAVPKTKMAFAGLKKEDERVNLLAYLKSMP
ncbi:MAG: cytochrome c family protein [Alphaproteobacteria bacterium]|jgi:cytochrome c|nr:cytochrome c family protein [Alphaproteobacteria bacterium]